MFFIVLTIWLLQPAPNYVQTTAQITPVDSVVQATDLQPVASVWQLQPTAKVQ